MRGLRTVRLEDGRNAVIIRTSDRIAFKQCRRKWAFSSHLKRNLGSQNLAGPLWFGSGIHYALEDFHGYNRFGRASKAFIAYCVSTAQNHLRELPSEAKELIELGVAMMDYYEDTWLLDYGRKPEQTYWAPNPLTGEMEPQVEVNFEIPIPLDNPELVHLKELCTRASIDCVLYRGTMDAVSIDDHGQLWVVEYKTAKRAENQHFQTDPQVSTYVWAATHIYDKPIAGVVYQQHVKNFPEPPRILSSGKLSTAKNQITSFPLYRRKLIELYGKETVAPDENRNYLWDLASKEDEDHDRYIQRSRVHRNPVQTQNEAQKILLELEDMLNEDLPLYPNPTRDCSRMCSFLSACVSMDDGSDWEYELAENFAERDQAPDRMWRQRLPDPQTLTRMLDQGTLPDVSAIQVQAVSANQERAARIAASEYGGDVLDLSEGFTFDMTRQSPLV